MSFYVPSVDAPDSDRLACLRELLDWIDGRLTLLRLTGGAGAGNPYLDAVNYAYRYLADRSIIGYPPKPRIPEWRESENWRDYADAALVELQAWLQHELNQNKPAVGGDVPIGMVLPLIAKQVLQDAQGIIPAVVRAGSHITLNPATPAGRGPVDTLQDAAGSDRRTQGRIKAYLDERRRLVELWRKEERECWPNRADLTPKELEELAQAEYAHGQRLHELARQHFGEWWESGHVEDAAGLWAYIRLVALPVVEAAPGAAGREIETALNGFGLAGLPTPDEPAWKTAAEALRVLRRLADSLYSQPPGGPDQAQPVAKPTDAAGGGEIILTDDVTLAGILPPSLKYQRAETVRAVGPPVCHIGPSLPPIAPRMWEPSPQPINVIVEKPAALQPRDAPAVDANRKPAAEDDGADSVTYDVFLCYNSADRTAAKQLYEELREGGLTVWFDDESVGMGASFLRDIEKGLRGSSSVAVCVGPTGIGPWQTEEIDAALQLAVREKRLVIPVLLQGAHDEPALRIFLQSRRWVDFRRGFTDEGLKRLVGDIRKASDERHRGTKKQ